METLITLKSGYRYRGKILKEDSISVTIDDIKYGTTSISKDVIAVRSDGDNIVEASGGTPVGGGRHG